MILFGSKVRNKKVNFSKSLIVVNCYVSGNKEGGSLFINTWCELFR